MRPSGRAPGELRPISLECGVAKYAEGSCLVRFGDTHVLCTASVDNRVPPFLRNSPATGRNSSVSPRCASRSARRYPHRPRRYDAEFPGIAH